MARVGVVGTTSWGTTLAILLASRGHRVVLWARSPEEAARLGTAQENVRSLPTFRFPASLTTSADPTEALGQAELVILAVPSRTLRGNVRRVASAINPGAIVLSATKGLEWDTGKRMSQVLAEELPSSLQSTIAVLTGPNLSLEVARRMPASTVVASREVAVAVRVQELVHTPAFRVYTSQDVQGAELGGALKNIIAIGAGICDGLSYGNNAKAAFVTRGLAEITRLGVAAGAEPLTFAGLAGLGDLITTCYSPLSRNHRVGQELAKGKPLDQVLASLGQVAEGVDTTAAALRLARGHGVEMPITEVTQRVLFQGLSPKDAAAELMGRAPGPEWPTNLTASENPGPASPG